METVLSKIYNFIEFAWLALCPSRKGRADAACGPKRLLIVRGDNIGDYVLFRGLLKAIRNSDKFKHFKITLCGNDIWRDLAETFDAGEVDDFAWVDRNRFIQDLKYRFDILRNISRECFDVVINPVYSREIYFGDAIVKLSGASERIGFRGDTTNIKAFQKALSDRFYTKLIDVTGENFELEKNIEFVEKIIGAPVSADSPRMNAEKITYEAPLAGRYAVIFSGSYKAARQWNAGNYSKVAEHLYTRYNLNIVIAGSKNDSTGAREIAAKCAVKDIIDLTGKTSLSQLAKVISGAVLLVSNETCAVHIAASLGKETVCVSNGNHFGRFNPYPESICRSIRYVYPPVIAENMGQYAMLCKKYGKGSDLDINAISAEEVIAEIDKAMKDKVH